MDYLSFLGDYRRQKKISEQTRQTLRDYLDKKGFSLLESDILFSLYYNKAVDTVTGICQDINRTKGVVSQSCDRLVQIGFVEAKTDNKDRRIIHFSLTEQAKEFVEETVIYLDRISEVMDLGCSLFREEFKYEVPVSPSLEELKRCRVVGFVDGEYRQFYPLTNTQPDYVKEKSTTLGYSIDIFINDYLRPRLEPGELTRFKKLFSVDALDKPWEERFNFKACSDKREALTCLFKLYPYTNQQRMALLTIESL